MKSLVVLAALTLPLPLAAQRLSVPAPRSPTRPRAPPRSPGSPPRPPPCYRDSNQAVRLDNLFRLHLLARPLCRRGRRPWPTGAAPGPARGDTTARGPRRQRAVRDLPAGQAAPGRQRRRVRRRLRARLPRAVRRLDDRAAALVARTSPCLRCRRRPTPPPTRRWPWPMPSPGSARMQIAETYAELGRLAAPADPRGRRAPLRDGIRHPGEDARTAPPSAPWSGVPAPDRPALPALLKFTIYADHPALLGDLRRNASNGYAGGHRASPAARRAAPTRPIPYVHDGADAAALIDWIARAAVERRPGGHVRRQLLGDVARGPRPSACRRRSRPSWWARRWRPAWTCRWKETSSGTSSIPGRSTPPTPRRSTTPPTTTGSAGAGSTARWYTSGRAYRDMDKIDGTPNPIWHDWIAHSVYDAYWQRHDPVRARVRRHQDPGAARPRATTSAGRAPRSTTSPSTTATTRAPSTTC